MPKLLSFTKNLEQQNILFDEYFAEHCKINILAYNYDGQGNALCECDGQITEIPADTIKRIIFGVSKETIENYLRSIFDPDSQTEFINRQNGHLLFRLLELKKLKKYDIVNLAKRTLKDFSNFPEPTFRYFVESQPNATVSCSTSDESLYGNTKSKVFHRKSCKSFNSITCTSLFSSHSEAESAGFKPCRICKP